MSTIVRPWERKLDFILKLLIFLSGMYQTFFGEHAIGIVILVCLVLITAPGLVTKNYIRHFPIEIEILLFSMILIQFVLGEARDLYINIPYYDKFVHYILPLFLGVIGFLIFFTLYATGKLKTSRSAMMVIIILITLGVGALWEIVEYANDVILWAHIPGWPHMQGNAQQDPFSDTMTDLVNDTIGAVFGALIGLWIIGRNYDKKGRMQGLVEEVSEILDKKR
jgi:hypothetical protein